MDDDKIRINIEKPVKQAKFVITLDDDNSTPANIIQMPKNKDDLLSGIIDVAKRLNSFVKENFSSKSEFIEKIGLSPEDALEYFSYKKPMDYNLLAKLAESGCDLNWLISGERKKSAKETSIGDKALFHEIDTLKKKNGELAKVITNLEKNLTAIKSNIQQKEEITLTPEAKAAIILLLEKQVKKVMFENFASFQKNSVTDLVKNEDLFSQIVQIFTQKSDLE